MDKYLIIDDHPVVLDGLSLVLQDCMPEGECLKANNGSEALVVIDQHRDMDWIFLDVYLPDINGVELLKQFETRKVTANIVMLSSDDSPAMADRALNQGANGFLSKSFDREQLQNCIDTVEQGKIFLSDQLKRELNSFRLGELSEKHSIESSLTERQRQTLVFLAKGYSNRQIAKSFSVTESTVKSHVQALMALFDADNRTHCVSEATRLGFL